MLHVAWFCVTKFKNFHPARHQGHPAEQGGGQRQALGQQQPRDEPGRRGRAGGREDAIRDVLPAVRRRGRGRSRIVHVQGGQLSKSVGTIESIVEFMSNVTIASTATIR